MRPCHVFAALAIGSLVSGFTSQAPRPEANDALFIAYQAASLPAATSPPPSEAVDASPAAGTPEDAIRAASVASPYRISEHAAMGKIRYRIAMRDGVPWSWPETGEQHVEHDADTVVLTICRTCGKEPPPTPAELQRDLLPNRWADNTDSYIRLFASDVRGATVDRRMRQLVRAVEMRMNLNSSVTPFQVLFDASCSWITQR